MTTAIYILQQSLERATNLLPAVREVVAAYESDPAECKDRMPILVNALRAYDKAERNAIKSRN